MKKYLTLFVCLIFMSAAFIFPCEARTSDSFSWYAKRNSQHEQPIVDREMCFVEQYNSYYVDKKYAKSNEKVIYLTFDAGYENGNITKILDILKETDTKANFFILENLLVKNTSLIKQMIEQGCLVGNHTSNHKDTSKLTFKELKDELENMETKYRELTGHEMSKFFRPPEGRFSKESLDNTSKLGYKTVFWSFAYADWDNSNQMCEEKAIKKIMDNVHNGEIMLLHPTSDTNVKVLPEVIKQLKAQGYRFETLDNL